MPASHPGSPPGTFILGTLLVCTSTIKHASPHPCTHAPNAFCQYHRSKWFSGRCGFPLSCTVVQQAIEQVLATMPESTRVGIITFGSMVYLHNLMATSIATSSVFRGTQEATKNDVAGHIRRGGAMQSPFLAPLGNCSFAMDGVLEGLTPEANARVRRPLPSRTAAHSCRRLPVNLTHRPDCHRGTCTNLAPTY